MFALAHLFFLWLLIIPVSFGIAIFYILTLQRAISRCAPHNRATSPESAWLLLIPFFNMVWQFILYPRISETLEREFRQRNLPIEPQPLRTLGLAVAILHVCWIIPVVHIFTGIAGIICWIFYWVKVSDYSNQLIAQPVGYPPPAHPQVQQPPPSPQPPSTRFCTKCGTPMQLNEAFCHSCGTQAI
jgi:hypothetical protein